MLLGAVLACNAPGLGRGPNAHQDTMAGGSTTEPVPSLPSTTSLPGEDGGATFGCTGAGRAVAVIVNPTLLPALEPALQRFRSDLCLEGYQAILSQRAFEGAPDLRSYLRQIHDASEPPLVGAILIGDAPHAYQWVTQDHANPDLPPLEEEVLSFQYYTDLDGSFSTSENYLSPGGHAHSFDVHRGQVDWEIWLGMLPSHGSRTATIAALNRYFERNHTYRVEGSGIPRRFLQITEHHSASTHEEHEGILSSLQSGQYAWTPFSSSAGAQFFFDSSAAGITVRQGYEALSRGVADFTVADAHGTWRAHGQVDVQWVQSHPIRTLFFWSNGCAVGNLDRRGSFLTQVLYGPGSQVLVAKGTTSSSGGMGTNVEGFFGHNIASAMAAGESFGQALLAHVNTPLVDPWAESRELHFAPTIVLGDPSLRLQP
jgi:hypothetical protein